MFLIKYTLENELDLCMDDGEILEATEDSDGVDDRVPSLFTVDDICVDRSTNEYYAVVQGDIQFFKDNNTENVNYIEVQEIPSGSNIQYLADKSDNVNDITRYYKSRTREKLNDEVGDIFDLLADLSKKVTMIERLGLYVAQELISNNQLPNTEERYGTLIDYYANYLEENDHVVDVADLEDSQELFLKLVNRTRKIKDIVKQEYTDKLQ